MQLSDDKAYVVKTDSGDKLNQLQTLYKDKQFLIILIIVLIVLLVYVYYKFNHISNKEESFQNVPLDKNYVDQQYSSLNEQREKKISNQNLLVEDSEMINTKLYNRFG